MPSGILGQADLAITTNTTVYTVPVGNVATVSVNVCNRNSEPIKFRLAIISGVIGSKSYLEYDQDLCGTDPYERTGIVLGSGQYIVVYSNTANVSANVYGWEEFA